MYAGVVRIVYEAEYQADYSTALKAQYEALADRLRGTPTGQQPVNFEPLGGQATLPPVQDAGPDPYAGA
jgi:hypothetical protein